MILLTRPEPDSQRIASDFQSRGHKTLISPLLKIQPNDVTLPPFDAICLSSKNAIFSLKSVSKKTPLYCVGNDTEKTLNDLGFKNLTTAPTALDLLEILRQQEPLGNLLYLSGKISNYFRS